MSTMHSGTPAGALLRLLEMGIEPYQVTSSISAVVNQRLVRRLCDECKKAWAATARFEPVGCEACLGTGFRGRTLIAEMVQLDGDLRKAILAKADLDALEALLRDKGHVPILADGKRLVEAGVTTQAELNKACGLTPESKDTIELLQTDESGDRSMATFEYNALTSAGRLMRGTIEAGSPRDAMDLLGQMGLNVNSVDKAGRTAQDRYRPQRIPSSSINSWPRLRRPASPWNGAFGKPVEITLCWSKCDDSRHRYYFVAVPSRVKEIDAVGIGVIDPDKEDICNARIVFENGCIANVTASRLALKTEKKGEGI